MPITAETKKVDVKKVVVENSTKLSTLQSFRNFFAILGTGIGSIFSLDYFNMITSMATTLKAFMINHMIFIVLGILGLTWVLLKWNEWKHMTDYQEGRYIPSGLAEDKEVKNDTGSV